MDYIKRTRELLGEKVGMDFVIPEKIKNNYEITDSLKDVHNWKAKTILANNGGKKDEMASVGYIALSPTSNIIIPISRNDEHQQGYEFLRHMISKKLIPNEKYVTIYGLGNNYIYGGQDKKYYEDAKTVYKKWLDMGGKDLKLEGYNGLKYHGNFSDFISRKSELKQGKMVIDTKTIFPNAKQLIKDFAELAKEYKELSGDKIIVGEETKKKNWIKKAFSFLDDNMEFIKLIDDYKKRHKIKEDLSGTDFQKASEAVFGMNGIKNTIHNNLRDFSVNTYTFKDKDAGQKYNTKNDYEEYFGNIESAKTEFDKLGGI